MFLGLHNVILVVLALHGHSLRTIQRQSSKVSQIPIINSIVKDIQDFPLQGVSPPSDSGASGGKADDDHEGSTAPGDEDQVSPGDEERYYNNDNNGLPLGFDYYNTANSNNKDLYEAGWAQGGGGCLSALAQQGWAAGNGYVKTHLQKNSRRPIVHTTSSGGTWMFVMTMGYLKGFSKHVAALKPIPSIYGQRCWGFILMNNLPSEQWPVIFAKCFDGRLRVTRLKDTSIKTGVNLKLKEGKMQCKPTRDEEGVWQTKCKQWHLWRLFGPLKPCTGNKEDYDTSSKLLNSKFSQLGFKRWFGLYKDFVWEAFFKPNHIINGGTFQSEFGVIGAKQDDEERAKHVWGLPHWSIHSSHVASPKGYVVPHSFPAVRDGVFSDGDVVLATAASSEAFFTGPLIAMINVANYGICPIKLTDIPKFLRSKPSDAAAAGSIWAQGDPSSFAESTLEEESNSTANVILQSLMQNLPVPARSLLQQLDKREDAAPHWVNKAIANVLGRKDSISTESEGADNENTTPLQIGDVTIKANLFTDPESERTLADGFLTDNNAVLPLVKEMELVAQDKKEQTVINVMMTPSSTRFALTDKINFFWSMQYVMPKIPRWATFHYNRTCKEDGGAQWVDNPSHVFNLPPDFIDESEDCIKYKYLPDFPPQESGCMNLYKIHKDHAVFIFTDLEVVPNKMFGIEGGWTLACLMFAIQVKTSLSERWLRLLAPIFVKQNGPWVKDFPNYASPSGKAKSVNSYQMLPAYVAYLLQNYLEHLAYSTAHCVLKGVEGAIFDICKASPDLCPCSRSSAQHSSFLAERFVFPQLYGNYNVPVEME